MNMTELVKTTHPLIPSDRADLIVQEYQENGFVGVTGAYSPKIAADAITDFEEIADPYESSFPGERRATVSDCVNIDIPATAALFLDGIERVAQLLGTSVWPAPAPETSIIDIIRMDPGAEGIAHRDILTVVGVVAIGTLAGDSRLLLEDTTEYALNVGEVVFLDASKRIWHQGIAGDSGERVGIVVAKEQPLALRKMKLYPN